MDLQRARQRSRLYADLAQALSEAKPGLEAEFTRLFWGPGRPVAHPYESVYREGRTVGDTTIDVRQLLVEEGLAPGGRTLPDHVGVELAFMAHLAAREAQAWEAENAERARGYLEREESFLRRHLLAWLPQFCRRVLMGRPHVYYADLVRRAEAFVGDDATQMRAWLQEQGPGSDRDGGTKPGVDASAVPASGLGQAWTAVALGQRCTLCRICVEVCRPGALQLIHDQERGIASLRFEAALCDGCAGCQRWCPENAIQVVQASGADSSRDAQDRPASSPASCVLPPSVYELATSAMLACPRCGQLHAPAAMVTRVKSRVETTNKALMQRLSLCHTCRMTEVPLRRHIPRGRPASHQE